MSSAQFTVLTSLGLREHHSLLDIGCGSLRAGRLFIPYLLPERYVGLEPERWLVEEGIRHEVGADLVSLKRPTFRYADDFRLSAFGRQFDFLLAHSIFTHATAGQIRACLREASKVMLPTSVFVATFMSGDEDYVGTEWVYPEVISYRAERIVELADEQGLLCQLREWSHPGGHTWLTFTQRA